MGEEEILKEAFEEAARIAGAVPKPFQVVAFQRALDEILGSPERDTGGKQASGGSSSNRKSRPSKASPDDTSFETLASKINRTEHPEISESMPVLQRSLAILKIAKDLGVDGLTPPRIAEILTEKFRVKTYRQHVSEQLSNATKLVDREKDGRGFSYRIMGAGEKLLLEFNEGKEAKAVTKPSRPTSRKNQGNKTTKRESSKAELKGKLKKGTRGRPGPKAAIEMLIDAGFFSEPRGMGDIQSRLKDKFGYVYKPTDLSPSLGRLLRDGKLDRDRNENGKYEYQQS